MSTNSHGKSCRSLYVGRGYVISHYVSSLPLTTPQENTHADISTTEGGRSSVKKRAGSVLVSDRPIKIADETEREIIDLADDEATVGSRPRVKKESKAGIIKETDDEIEVIDLFDD